MATLEYRPDRVSPPGDTLSDLLEERRISQKQLAVRLARSDKLINEIIKGKATISSDLALDLERVLGTPARFWLNRESAYREWLARNARPNPSAQELEWTKLFPYPAMVRYGWVPAANPGPERVYALLQFFGMASLQAYRSYWEDRSAMVRFRRSDLVEDRLHLVSAWLRQGEIQSSSIEAASYDEPAFRDAVTRARGWTQLAPRKFVPLLKEAFAQAGVIIEFVPELPSLGVSGAVRWKRPDCALMQISLRYKRNDHFWFTLFHECAHVIKHKKKSVFLEVSGEKDADERDADRMAATLLIPSSRYAEFVRGEDFSRIAVKLFAEAIGIAPGIVVGRLQHDNLLPHKQLNDLKVKYEWIKPGHAGW
ncbi:MAG: XRE family transcriptional regulator [Armatimonadetes bacterium]|nr:XRE family transcriptional regulator [Armatimonadota bacterium]